MFVDLMNDIYNTFSERFLKVQLVFEQPVAPPPQLQVPKKRYNALGILEDIPAEEPEAPRGTDAAVDIGPPEPLQAAPVARKDPTIVGAGRTRSVGNNSNPPANMDWSSVGRNDPCPCGSGKKFKKCHGATL